MPEYEYLRYGRCISPALRHYELQFLAKGCTAIKARELARRKFARKGWPPSLERKSPAID